MLDIEISTLDQIEAFFLLLLHHFETKDIGFSDLSSPSSVARFLMARHSRKQFQAKLMDPVILRDFYLASHGGRNESSGIGTADSWNYDMRRAHLSIIAQLPSLSECHYYKDFDYNPEAMFGAYQIDTTIPKMDMCPLPVELEYDLSVEVAHPYGKISGWYAKPYLDLLTTLKLPFKVRKSHQYILIGKHDLPFKNMTEIIANFIDKAPGYINAKGLYYGMAGSTISWRWRIVEDTGEIFPGTFGVFNPIIYSQVLATQSTRIFRESRKSQVLALRSDAITVEKKIATSLKLEDNGDTTFITPMFKTFPSGRGSIWRELIEGSRDASYIDYYIEDYPTVRKFLERDKPLGRLTNGSIRVRPNHGRRIGEVPKRVGSLLDNWFPSESSSVEGIPIGLF